MASILGAKTGQMTFSALFNPLMILSCALLAVYIGFRVAAYKNHGIDCKNGRRIFHRFELDIFYAVLLGGVFCDRFIFGGF